MLLKELLNKLPEPRRHMVRLRFGIGDRSSLTTKEVAAAFSTSECGALDELNAGVDQLRELVKDDEQGKLLLWRAGISMTGRVT
jgi:DNA-directed RNA polymerase sigma subunit (sigma70/sigma32)